MLKALNFTMLNNPVVEAVVGISILFWPLILGLVYRAFTKVPGVLKRSLLYGYGAMALVVLQSVLIIYTYLKPLNTCMLVTPQPELSTCTSLSPFMIQLVTQWNYLISTSISFVVVWVLLTLYTKKFNKALNSDAERAGAR